MSPNQDLFIAQAAAGLPGELMILLDGAAASDVLTGIFDRFLFARDAAWWWEVLKEPYQIVPGKSLEDVPSICPDPEAEVYLVPCDSWPLRVYRATPRSVARVLGECPCMEYAVVAEDLSWMIIENHHDEFYVAGDFGRLDLARSGTDRKASFIDLPDVLKKLSMDADFGLRGTLHIEAWLRPPKVPELLASLGFAYPDKELFPISRDEAILRLSHLVAYDQAFDYPTEAIDIAEECAREFVRIFAEDCRFFTNSQSPAGASARSFNPLTNATFDSGVIAISADKGGVFWFEDED